MAGSLAGASSASNLSATTLDLTATNGIGTSAAVLQTSVNTLTANGGTGGGLFLSNNETLTVTSASATGGAVSITAGRRPRCRRGDRSRPGRDVVGHGRVD